MKLKNLLTSFCVVVILSGCGQNNPAPTTPTKEVTSNTYVSSMLKEQKSQDKRTLKRTMEVYSSILKLDDSLPSLEVENGKCSFSLFEDTTNKAITMLDDEFKKELSISNKNC